MNKEEKKKLLEKTILDHQTMLYRIAFSIVKEEQAALDVVQETIVKAYSQIGQLRQPCLLYTSIRGRTNLKNREIHNTPEGRNLRSSLELWKQRERRKSSEIRNTLQARN